MTLNLLYACLTYNAPVLSDNYYEKQHTPVSLKGNTKQLIQTLTAHVSSADLYVFATHLCRQLCYSKYAEQIQVLDPTNTYRCLEVKKLVPFYTWLPTETELKRNAYLLDTETQALFQEAITVPDKIALYCIQILKLLKV